MRLTILFILFSQIVVAQNQQQFMKTASESQYPSGYVHCDAVTIVKDVVNPETGQVWMDRNLGASKVADSLNDAAAYGDLFQWGRFADGHQCRNSATTSTNATTATPTPGTAWYGKFILETVSPYDWLDPQNDNLWQGVNGVNNPCPNGYRLPTETELNEERLTWSSNNNAGAYASPLKLPVSGYRSLSSGGPFLVGSNGYYWSSSVSGSNARYLRFLSGNADMPSDSRAYGLAVRCIKDITSRYPEGYIHSDTNNITQIKDVLSETGNIWMDRNLGATRVATSSTDSEAYGDLFQWGRFADGHQKRTSDTTSVNATTEVPNLGNTWDGDFITEVNSPFDWLIPQDDNLWQGINGVNNPCPQGYRVPTESELQAEDNTFSPNNSTGAFASPLKLPAAGDRSRSSGALSTVGSYGFYWSSSVSGSDARGLYFYSGDALLLSGHRAYGSSVRCIKDLPSLYAEGTVFCNEPTKIVPVVSLTGKTWMDRNLGASQRATAFNDANAYGDLYQWGRFADGHQCRDSDTTSTNAITFVNQVGTPWYGKFITEDQSPFDWLTTPEDELWQGEDGVNNPCPDGFRIPTEAELNAERLSWSSNDAAGAYASPLKLPAAGLRGGSSGALASVGSNGNYWSSSVSGINARRLNFNSGGAYLSSFSQRAYGYSVRCIKDYQPLYAENYVHCTAPTNVVDVVSATGKVWMDRNLGASQVATSSTDTSAYGDLFQWGRAADGHQCRSATTTSTNATTVNPLEGNSWDGLFITESASPYDWLTTPQDNLWQGVDGANNPCPNGYRIPTETELDNERLSWDNDNSAGAYASPLKLPVGGNRREFGDFRNVGENGYYWSSSVFLNESESLYFGSITLIAATDRARGYSIRCIKD